MRPTRLLSLPSSRLITGSDIRTGGTLKPDYALKDPSLTGSFYYFNSLTNPINQPSIPGTKSNSSLLIKPFVLLGTSPDD